jgi:phthiocerol/phenolphthiocerol synthesis type-I polyketide synthase E
MTTLADSEYGGRDVAVIGIGCRFPGAADPEAFWDNLAAGVESVTFFTGEQLAAAGAPGWLRDHPRYVPAQGVLRDADRFDAAFFGVSPQEAALLDPQQRVLLECAWHTLEDAGRPPSPSTGRIALFAGGYRNSYVELAGRDPDPHRSFLLGIGNEPDYLASRAAYLLDLTGPAVTVQTACSSSLVAVHLAVQALLSGECELALAGGVTVRAAEGPGYVAAEGGLYSPDGHCRAFDAAADGAVIGEGVGLVALKRLSAAQADGDRIRAVIKGSAIGNDGAERVGYTAPSVAGQARIVSAALRRAGVDPRTVGYVEAHGSGTPMGDRIEIDALTQAYRAHGWEYGQRPIGSVKTNIGHTHAAAGIAGLIKAVLALEHGRIPPSLNFEHPNPSIDFATSPFRVARQYGPWPIAGRPRRAGVSSFGLGGTGAHVVLEEAPAALPVAGGVDLSAGVGAGADGPRRAWHLLTYSARDADALDAVGARLAERLESADPPALGDVGYTLHLGRREFEQRRFVLADDARSAARALAESRGGPPGRGPGGGRKIAFLLPGVGDQYVGMAALLYRTEPVFRRQLDRCAALLREREGIDLLAALYPEGLAAGPAAPSPIPAQGPGLRAMRGRGAAPAPDGLAATRIAEPAIFAIEYAPARLLAHWGVRPDALLGYSVGEFTAACLAGVLTLEDAAHLVAERARILDALPGGAMLAVPLDERAAARIAATEPQVAVAAVNGPGLCVLAGPDEAVARCAERLAADGILSRPMQTTHAFHTPMMRPAAEQFADLVASCRLREPEIPYVSNVTGDWITPAEAVDPAYWVRHLCEPVRFGQGVARLCDDPDRVLVEVGPGRALGSLALRARPDGGADGVEVAASLPSRYEPEDRFLLSTVGQLWLAGVQIDWEAYHSGEARTKVALPGYPFRRTRHWLDAQAAMEADLSDIAPLPG